MIRLPGLIDPHVHLREPGFPHKEDFTSGTAAALAGGFTTVLDMPNTLPPTATPERLAQKQALAQSKALCDVGLFVGAVNDIPPDRAAEAGKEAIGLKIYVSETFGSLRIDHLDTLAAYFEAWQGPGPIAVHAEDIMLPACLALAQLYDQPLHVVHVSRRAEIETIVRAKERGLPVTCEVTPHHLFLTRADAQRLGPFGQMKPPLAGDEDRRALWEHLDAIDCIATDHAPHTLQEKQGPQPPPGVPGLETALPLMLRAVAEGRLTLDDLIARMHLNPARIYGIPTDDDTYIEVDETVAWEIPFRGWRTRADWSPFAGMQALGRVTRVVIRGVEAYREGEILVAPGFGRVISPVRGAASS
jgi:carbamoyl-phosphate synthase/aspartate carbamoyltransferase/dihydroorotase